MPSQPTKREKQAPKPGTPIETLLDPDEWDFRDIDKKWELPYAVIYEYARSSKYRGALTEWFQQPCAARISRLVITQHPDVLRACGFRGNLPRGITVGELIEHIYNHAANEAVTRQALYLLCQDTPPVFHQQKLLCLALRFPQFPDPWVRVRRTNGVEYIQKRCFKWPSSYEPLVELGDETDPHQDPLYAARANSRPANIQQHQFEIDWAANAPAIKKSFNKWLSRHHPYGPGNRAVAEPLSWLGAYRIKALGKLSDAHACSALQNYFIRSEMHGFGPRQLYRNVNKWSDSAGKAELILSGCFAEDLARRSKQLWLV